MKWKEDFSREGAVEFRGQPTKIQQKMKRSGEVTGKSEARETDSGSLTIEFKTYFFHLNPGKCVGDLSSVIFLILHGPQ